MKMLETAISQGLASVVDLQWPSKRWPIHVFTAGAMICLATSTICHLFGSVGPRQAQVTPTDSSLSHVKSDSFKGIVELHAFYLFLTAI